LTDAVFNHYDNAFDQTEHFVYDLVGNRLSQTLDKGNNSSIEETTTYTYDANDRLALEAMDTDDPGTTANRSTSYTYDHTQQTGKAVSENSVAVNSTTFEYDLRGRLEVATVTTHTAGVASHIEKTTYDYDARGIRVSALHEIDADASGTVDSSTKSEYLNDAQSLTGYSQVLQETVIDPTTGEIQKRIVYAIGHDHIGQTTVAYSGGVPQSSETLFFGTDGHGSVRVLLDMAGAIASVAGVQQLFHYDAYGNALGFNPAHAATSYLYSGEQFDTRIGQQYLRARYYDPNAGRFNRLDPFFGNLNDPQSLHKYGYVHAEPVQGVDPSGLLAGGATSTGTAMSGALSISGMNLAATLLVIKAVHDLLPKTDPLLRRIAEGLDVEIRIRTDVEKDRDRNPNYMYFVHGSSSGLWLDDTVRIDPQQGSPRLDFGLGFYTFRASNEGITRATERAVTMSNSPNGGTSFVLVVRMLRAHWNRLTKMNYGTRYNPTNAYLPDVNAFRSGKAVFTGKDVAFGAVAHRAATGNWTWVANPAYPEQYKFETIVGVSRLEPVALVPIITTYLA